MSSPQAPAAPNYSNVISAVTNNAGLLQGNAQQQQNLAGTYAGMTQDQLNWAKDAYNQNQAFTKQEQNRLLDTQDFDSATGKAALARYQSLYYPMEDQYVSDVRNYASPERKAAMRGQAVATVGQAFDAANKNASQNLEGMGVDPGAVRYGALNLSSMMQRAGAQAGAATKSDTDITNTGLALEGGALSAAAGQPGGAVGTLNAGTGAGTGAVSAGNQTTATSAGSLGNPLGYAGAALGGYGGAAGSLTGAGTGYNSWGQMMNNSYNNQMGQFNAASNSSSGIGSILGMAGGAGASLLGNSSNAAGATGLGMLFAKRGGMIPGMKQGLKAGAAVGRAVGHGPRPGTGRPAVGGGERAGIHPIQGALPPMAPPQGAPQGGPQGAVTTGYLPPDMSPSDGQQTDDIPGYGPGGEVRVNAGEFILPRRTVQHYGTKFLQNLIAKGDKASGLPQQAPAAPEMKEAVPSMATGGRPFGTGALNEMGVTRPIPMNKLEPPNPRVGHMVVPTPTMALPRGIGAPHMRTTPSFRPMRLAA